MWAAEMALKEVLKSILARLAFRAKTSPACANSASRGRTRALQPHPRVREPQYARTALQQADAERSFQFSTRRAKVALGRLAVRLAMKFRCIGLDGVLGEPDAADQLVRRLGRPLRTYRAFAE